ncbi:dermonecrotic toxin domain-containing protein [Pseudomonas qingdaonensis]|uniref:dermonecrotic toxin domain-containing protein n=1 Tax=Pseudomonas qingdaonensis TaxID=2056231 RepID=UPI0028A67E4A|nr:DUF6543 domain-containing protein [Pseudomonas qingdaonensis]
MPLKTLPYFHRVALRQRFADHLAQARDSLDDEEHRWLQGWLQAPGPDAPRIDRLSAITASAHASELTASLLLSRSTHPRVFFYHPLLGLLRFEDRTQLKHHLVELLSSGHPHVLLHYIAPRDRLLAGQGGIVDVQVERLEDEVFEYLMLVIAARQGQALGELQQQVLGQPPADSLWEQALATTTTATAAAAPQRLAAARDCQRQLHRYWHTAKAGSETPARQLARLMGARVREAITCQAWAGALAETDHAAMLQWLDTEALSPLQAFSLNVTTAQGHSQLLEGVLALDTRAGPVFTWCAARGLERHASKRALLSSLTAPRLRDSWRPVVSPSRQSQLGALRISALHLQPLAAPALDSWVGQVLSAQQQDIETQLRPDSGQDGFQACRQALDLDSRLAGELARLGTSPHAYDSPATLARLQASAQAAGAGLEELNRLVSALTGHAQALFEEVPGLETVTAAGLDQALAAVLDKGPPVTQVRLGQPGAGRTWLSLAELVWQRLGGIGTSLDERWLVSGPVVAEQPVALPALDLALARQAVAQVADATASQLASALTQYQAQRRTYLKHLWQLALTLEYRLLDHDSLLPAPVRALIHAALFPAPSPAAPAWVWQLALDQAPSSEALLLTRQPLEAQPDLWLLWTLDQGFAAFTSRLALEQAVAARYPAAQRFQWLALAGAPAHHLQSWQAEHDVAATRRAFDRLTRRGLPAAHLPDLLRSTLDTLGTLRYLQRLQRLASARRLRAHLPDWLAQAAPSEQYGYLQVLGRNLLQSPSSQDYLFDIPAVTDYARQRVQARLDQDFAAGRYPADQLLITTTRWVTALPPTGEVPTGEAAASIQHRQTLVDYALNHYRDWDHAITAITLEGDMTVPARIDAAYLRALVRELDLGQGYRQLLAEQLDRDHASYPRRLRLFCRQLPGQLLEAAWRARLQGQLGAADVECIRAVVEQPDATARDQLPAPAAQLLPLELIADSGLPPDTVPGVYLFMYASPAPGPVVMYTPYQAGGLFQAFSSSADLLQQLRSVPALQARILACMPDTMRPRYDHGGFTEAHLPYSAEFDFELPLYAQQPVTLAWRPVHGNALQYLFETNAALLQGMAHTQLVSTAEARWATLKEVLGLLWGQLTLFIPGRIGLLLAAWQGELSLLQLAERPSGDWAQALSELTCTLVQGLLAGHGVREQGPGALPADEGEFWRRLGQASHQRLSAYEVPQQSLDGLASREQIYTDVDGQTQFACLEGKVYGVRQLDQRWHLSAPDIDEPGPRLLSEGNGRWQIDPQQAIPVLSGGIIGRLGGWASRQVMAGNDIVIRAVGMRQIQRLMPARARMLRQAHRTALDYLGICLDNLQQASPVQRMPAQTRTILSDFFGVEPDEALLQRVREPVEKLFELMTSQDYSVATSRRYILASNIGNYTGIAFTSPHDPLRQLFLLDAYFDVSYLGRLQLRPELSWQEADAIARANCLLHEFSHIAYDTRDMRYLDASLAFADLLMPGEQQDWLRRQHDEAFSHRSPARRLFVVRSRDGTRRDITRDDNKGLSLILKIADTRDLAVARQRFLDDAVVRSRIMLKNADSLTLLVYRLGQASHRPPAAGG